MLQDPTLAPRLVKHLDSKAPMEERIQAAVLGRFLTVGWTPELRSELLGFFSLARGTRRRQQLSRLSDQCRQRRIENDAGRGTIGTHRQRREESDRGMGVIQNLSGNLTPEQIAALLKLDKELAADKSPAAAELAKATIVALGAATEPRRHICTRCSNRLPIAAATSLRRCATTRWPTRRAEADWPLLIRSLTVVDGSTARDVLRVLAKSPAAQTTRLKISGR